MIKTIYLVTDDDRIIVPMGFENKQKAINYACKIHKGLTRDYETEHYSQRELREHYNDCADGVEDYSINGILLQRVKIVLDN